MIQQGTPDPIVRKRKLSSKPKRDRDLGDVVGDGGLQPGAPVKLLNWKLDWRAYFHRFCADHGGNPIEIGGRLVLPDGWAYSCTDYRGPEWPPPTNPVAKTALLIAYWTERAGIVRDELKLLRITRKSMLDQMVARSSPMIKRVKRFDEAKGKNVAANEELSLDSVDARIGWLEADLEHSAEQLEELNHVQASRSS